MTESASAFDGMEYSYHDVADKKMRVRVGTDVDQARAYLVKGEIVLHHVAPDRCEQCLRPVQAQVWMGTGVCSGLCDKVAAGGITLAEAEEIRKDYKSEPPKSVSE